jgi:hypothetical protein
MFKPTHIREGDFLTHTHSCYHYWTWCVDINSGWPDGSWRNSDTILKLIFEPNLTLQTSLKGEDCLQLLINLCLGQLISNVGLLNTHDRIIDHRGSLLLETRVLILKKKNWQVK